MIKISKNITVFIKSYNKPYYKATKLRRLSNSLLAPISTLAFFLFEDYILSKYFLFFLHKFILIKIK